MPGKPMAFLGDSVPKAMAFPRGHNCHLTKFLTPTNKGNVVPANVPLASLAVPFLTWICRSSQG